MKLAGSSVFPCHLDIPLLMDYMKTADIDLYGFAYNCPSVHRINNCPFSLVEQLPFKQKVLWINGLSNEEKELILEHHKACSIKR